VEKRRLKRLQVATPYRNAASTEHGSTGNLVLEPVVAKTDKEEAEFGERWSDLDSDESDHNSEAYWQQEFKVNLRATAQSDFILTHRISTGASRKL